MKKFFKKAGKFYIEKEEEILVNTYNLIKKVDFYDRKENNKLTELFDLSVLMKKVVYDIILIIDFTFVNIETLEHILLKIDKHTQAFQAPIFKDFFFNNYENSTMRHFIEHPGLLRVYFQIKFLKKKMYLFLKKIQRKNNDSIISVKNLNVSFINKFEEICEFGRSDFESYKNFLDEEQQDNIILQIKKNLEETTALLNIQNNFFKMHHENIFIEKGIHFGNYFNKEKLEKKAIEIYNKTNKICSKETFLEIELKYEEEEKTKPKAIYSLIDIWLVIIHTFLYLTNQFGLQLTSSLYVESLLINDLIVLLLRILLPLSVIISGFFFNWITSNNKYLFPYYLSLSLLICGNLFYFLAESLKNSKVASISIFIIGRFLLAFGGSRLMTRKFIAINIETWAQSHYAALFVLMSALGQTFGPGFGSSFSFIPEFTLGFFTFRDFNCLAFLFLVIWIIVFIFFIIFFKGYDKSTKKNMKKIEYEEYLFDQRKGTLSAKKKKLVQKISKKFTTRNFKINPFKKVVIKRDMKKHRFSKINKKAFQKKKLPIFKAYFPNIMTVFTLLNFMLFKLYQEAYFTELPQMANHYYSHTKTFIGFFLLLSSLYAVPVSLFALFFKKYPSRYLLILAFIIFILAITLKINYTYNDHQNIVQFYIGNCLLYSGSLIGEASTIAITSKVISPTLKRGFVNAGFILGIGATVARALGFWGFYVFFGFGVSSFSFLWYFTAFFIFFFFFFFFLVV